MNILVCFKSLEDIEKQLKENWILDGDRIPVQYLPKILNCFDESALEMALRFSETSESSLSVCKKTAFTIGDASSERFLKLMQALKFDETVFVKTDADIRFLPQEIAKIIADYAQKSQQQLILTGISAGFGDNGQTAYYLAENLNFPCITNVIDFSYENENSLRVLYENDEAIIEEKIQLPHVLAIGNAQISYLRIPTLKDKIEAKNKEVQQVESTVANNKKNHQLYSIEIKNTQRKAVQIEGSKLEEQIAKLCSENIKPLLEKLS